MSFVRSARCRNVICRALVLLVLIMLGCAHALVVHANDYVVTDCGDNGGSNQLRAKVLAATTTGGGTITFSCGPNITLQHGSIAITNSRVTINGGKSIILSGNNQDRIFVVESSATLALYNMTLTHGYQDGDGGAIYSLGTLIIVSCYFTDNQALVNASGGAIIAFGHTDIYNSSFFRNKAGNGGALYLKWSGSITTISNSGFSDNATLNQINGWGGAILVFDGAKLTIENSNIQSNEARLGGGVYVFTYNSQLELRKTLVLSNSAVSQGGGIFNNEGAIIADDSVFSNNTAGLGGGIYNQKGSATLSSSTIDNNRAASRGGGIYTDGILFLTNVTVSVNDATVGGGVNNQDTAIFTNVTFSNNTAIDGAALSGDATVKNTLFAKGSNGSNCSGTLTATFSYSDDNSCGLGAGHDNIDLKLGPLALNGGPTRTHMPLPGSPAIDNGTGAGCPETDQRGVPRPQGPACDVGAVEYTPTYHLFLPGVVR
jgi:predicted outer membrane repeat protein